ncbi:hypothetical protein CDL12_03361 [Handroanthus impetiginosus]|uniref:Uncharacterized protein n=1 Tax=Handroanthus impetiginosus TaxID=429701 RepID=A0A2G9I2C2_9LAMI|nr:hypothetical protein CDL12_03361 [Handroanthus impetiginosus]
MDKEEDKMGLKRNTKPVETLFDSDDDEPIGTLLKLKGKRNSKKSKLAADGGKKVKRVEKMAAEDEEFGGMDDTLANFRKKLRGPKKDGVSAVAVGKGLSSDVVEPLSESVDDSAKNWELDPNLICEAQKRGLERAEGGFLGDATVLEGSKVKKMKNNRSKVNSSAKIPGNTKSDGGFDYHRAGNDASQHEKDGAPESEVEALEDSLSAFFQKVQSGMNLKSRNASRMKQGKETQVSDDGSNPNSGATSEASVRKTHPASVYQSVDDHLPEVSDCALGKSANSSLRACSGKIAGAEDSRTVSEATGGQPCSTNELLDSADIPDRSNEVFHCVEAKDLGPSTSSFEGIAKINDDAKLSSRLETGTGLECSGQEQFN